MTSLQAVAGVFTAVASIIAVSIGPISTGMYDHMMHDIIMM